MDFSNGIGAAFAAAGASLALAFIVCLILGLAMVALVYIGSAVVVLERFARVVRRPGWPICFGILASLFGAALTIGEGDPELASRTPEEWWRGYLALTAQMGVACAASIALCAFVLRRFEGRNLGLVVVCVIGLGGSTGLHDLLPPAWHVAPFAIALAGLFATRRTRVRANLSQLGEPEWVLGIFCGAWALGLLTYLYPAPTQEVVANGGLALLGFFFAVVISGLLPLAAAGLVEMKNSVEWFIAIRYLVAKRRQVFISAISAICVGGIAAGVWLIIVVLSVMNGFETNWRDEILGNRAHFTVHSGTGSFGDYESVLEIVRDVDGVTGASPYLDAQGMVRGSQGEIFSIRLRGVDPETVADVTDLRQDIISGSIDDLQARPEGESNLGAASVHGIIIGNQLAVSSGARVGDELLLISPFGGPQTPLGPAPRLQKFRVAAIFQSSFFQYDEVFTYTSIPAAQEFRRAGDVVDGIEARTTDHYRSARVGASVREALGYPFYSRDWKEFFPAFFQALKSERVMMFLLLTMIMVVAAFLIVATLIMMIMEKSSDIAILKAMGAEDAAIERIFAIEGTLIGLMGTAIGVVAGVAVTKQLTWLQGMIEQVTGIDTLPASIYQFSELPSQVDPAQIGLVASIAMILSLGATLLPSRQGARLDPAEGLRYE